MERETGEDLRRAAHGLLIARISVPLPPGVRSLRNAGTPERRLPSSGVISELWEIWENKSQPSSERRQRDRSERRLLSGTLQQYQRPPPPRLWERWERCQNHTGSPGPPQNLTEPLRTEPTQSPGSRWTRDHWAPPPGAGCRCGV